MEVCPSIVPLTNTDMMAAQFSVSTLPSSFQWYLGTSGSQRKYSLLQDTPADLRPIWSDIVLLEKNALSHQVTESMFDNAPLVCSCLLGTRASS